MCDDWLPNPLDEASCDVEERYRYFRSDFIEYPPAAFDPKIFRVDDRMKDGKEVAFYHLTTTGGEERRHDPYRCSRIRWCKPIIQRVDSQDVITWRVRQKGENRVKIALNDFQYLVVLSEESATVRLVTAFYVHDEKQRGKIKKESERPNEGA